MSAGNKITYVEAVMALKEKGWNMTLMGKSEIWVKQVKPGRFEQKDFLGACKLEGLDVLMPEVEEHDEFIRTRILGKFPESDQKDAGGPMEVV